MNAPVTPASFSSSPKTARYLGLSAGAVTILLITASTLARFFIATTLPLLPDETYYFQWSKHLDASYLSKGPAIAYTIWVGTHLWGGTTIGIRFFAVLLSAGTAWQLFLLARRWFDEKTALLAVLLTSVVPLYNLGAVVMTIDPLSAFFWIWAANLFTTARASDRAGAWAVTGFAVGCGFLAKYLNGLELLSFVGFLASSPTDRRRLLQPGFWILVGVTLVTITPVFYWNAAHGWPTVANLENRANLGHPTAFDFCLPFAFLSGQALVISPLLFLALLLTVVMALIHQATWQAKGDGERFMIFLAAPVFLFYLVLSVHYVGEPNWPAISYFSLVILFVASLRAQNPSLDAQTRVLRFWAGLVGTSAFLSTLLLHATPFTLPAKIDPLSRFVGWKELAHEMENQRTILRAQHQTPLLIADAYKEASVISFYLPDQAFVFTRYEPPLFDKKTGMAVPRRASQFDMWPSYGNDLSRLTGGGPSAYPNCALYITEDASGNKVADQFSSRRCLEAMRVLYRGRTVRRYFLFLCQNPRS